MDVIEYVQHYHWYYHNIVKQKINTLPKLFKIFFRFSKLGAKHASATSAMALVVFLVLKDT